jgi:conjugative transposon TraM protein
MIPSDSSGLACSIVSTTFKTTIPFTIKNKNMTQPQHSPQFLRKRKMMLVLPLLVLPFVCIVFVALGGGKGDAKKNPNAAGSSGFNMTLPGAHFAKKETVLNKLAFYEKADEDSAKLLERMKQDPYHLRLNTRAQAKATPQGQSLLGMAGSSTDHFISHLNAVPGEDSNANKLLRQLDQLKQVLHRPAMPAMPAGFPGSMPSMVSRPVPSSPAPEMNRLEKLMQTIKAADTATSDPQLEKLSGMLDKIIKIQHPGQEPSGEKTALTVEAPAALSVTTPHESAAVADLAANPSTDEDTGYKDADGFYSIDEVESANPAAQNAMTAVIPEDQTLVAGATITLRLTQDAVINGVTIPRDNPVYGLVTINGDRMGVTVSSIRYRQGIYPVGLQVYDMDGLPGIHIPGAITRDVAKESADQGVSSMGLNALDPSLAGQAATAGIEAAKTLISRKIRLVRVSVKAGYQVLLKNTKSVTH